MNIRDLIQIEGLSIDIIAGNSGMDNEIKNEIVYFPELLIAGFDVSDGKESIQILSRDALDCAREILNLLRNLTKVSPPCIIIPHDIPPPDVLIQICGEEKIPLLVTHSSPLDTRNVIEHQLEREFAPSVLVHGTLIDVYGMGVLLKGTSGIGKTECALDLVFRGHRLVADDVVRIIKRRNGKLEGEGVEESKKLKHHIEIRGIGILDMRSIFGIRGVRERKAIELVVNLYEGLCKTPNDITGIERKICKILGQELTEIRIPLVAGKNISALIEVIALNKLLKLTGTDSANEFNEELIRVMKSHRKKKGKTNQHKNE